MACGVTLTVHDPPTREQEPPLENTTVPTGVIAPWPEESVTMAVQLEAWFTTTLLGIQLTLVELVLRLTPRPKG